MSSLPDARRTSTPWATAALLILPCAAICLASAAQAPLTLVSTAWSPFTNAPGQPRFALDLVETALGRIGLAAKTTIVPAAEFTSSLLAPAFDGSAAAWKDSDRERVLVFSQPYLENRLVLVGRHGDDVPAKALTDLKGKRVAIVDTSSTTTRRKLERGCRSDRRRSSSVSCSWPYDGRGRTRSRSSPASTRSSAA